MTQVEENAVKSTMVQQEQTTTICGKVLSVCVARVMFLDGALR